MTFKELIESTNTRLIVLSKAIHVDNNILSKYKCGIKPPKYLMKDIDRFFGEEVDLEYQPMYLPNCKHEGCHSEYKGKCMLLENNLGYEETCPFYSKDVR